MSESRDPIPIERFRIDLNGNAAAADQRLHAGHRLWIDPLTNPAARASRPARAAWSTKRWNVGSGIAKLTKISTFGPAFAGPHRRCLRAVLQVEALGYGLEVDGHAGHRLRQVLDARCAGIRHPRQLSLGRHPMLLACALDVGVGHGRWRRRGTQHAAGKRSTATPAPSARPMGDALSVAHTAVPLPEQHEREVLAAHRYSLPAPQTMVLRPKGWQQRPPSLAVLATG